VSLTFERRSRHQRYDRMGLACSVGEGRTGASRISGLCANFHPCRVSPQPRSPLFRWSTRCLGIGLAPNAALKLVQIRRRLRTTPARNAGAGSRRPACPPPFGCAGCGLRAARGSATLIAGAGAGWWRGGRHPCCPARCVGQERCLLARSVACYTPLTTTITGGRLTDGASSGLSTLGNKGEA